MARRIMRRFILKEISGVDSPAQAHARAVIIKRDVRSKELDMSLINDASALSLLEAAAAVLKKREPSLSKEMAFAKIYADPDFRDLAKLEREESEAKLAGVPVASLEPVVLQDLSDDEIRSIADQIQEANPFIGQAELFRLIGVTVQERQARQTPPTKRPLRSTNDRGAPGANHDARGTAKSDALSELNARADELRKAHPDITEAQAFAAAYTSPANRDLAKRERAAAMAALES